VDQHKRCPDPLVQYAIWVPSRDATLVLISAWAGNSAHSYRLLVSVSDSNPAPEIASVDLLNFQDRHVWLITKAPHRYPGGRGLQPGHEPVCSDLTESLSAHKCAR
jgi:hypothetical protein